MKIITLCVGEAYCKKYRTTPCLENSLMLLTEFLSYLAVPSFKVTMEFRNTLVI